MTTVTQYLWDPVLDCVLQEYDGDGHLTVEYANEPAPFGPVVSQHRDGVTSHFLHDALGSTLLITDDAGTVTDSFVYDAWGQPTLIAETPRPAAPVEPIVRL